jgi:allantoinase
VIALARETGARVHVLHLSSADALPMIAAAHADGVALTDETCPHYLTFTAEEIADGATQFDALRRAHARRGRARHLAARRTDRR